MLSTTKETTTVTDTGSGGISPGAVGGMAAGIAGAFIGTRRRNCICLHIAQAQSRGSACLQCAGVERLGQWVIWIRASIYPVVKLMFLFGQGLSCRAMGIKHLYEGNFCKFTYHVYFMQL